MSTVESQHEVLERKEVIPWLKEIAWVVLHKGHLIFDIKYTFLLKRYAYF